MPKVTPWARPSKNPGNEGENACGVSDRFIWEELAPRLIHPLKVELIEALSWINRPLTVSEFHAVLNPSKSPLTLVQYHVRELCRVEVLVERPSGDGSDHEEPRYSFNWEG